MRRRLSDRLLRSLQPAQYDKRYEIQDDIVRNLAVRVTDRGVKSFVVIARYPGGTHWTRATIGHVGGLSLEDARAISRSWNAQLRKGEDPRRRTERRTDTFSATVEAYLHHIAGHRRV